MDPVITPLLFPEEEARYLTDASKHGELGSHLNRLLLEFPDDCPKACDVMLVFLSCLADAKFVSRLIQKKVLGTLKEKMVIDTRRFRELRKYIIYYYNGQCPHLIFKGFQRINLSDWPEMYREERRKHDQATYALRFKVRHEQIFSGFERESDMGLRSRKGLLSLPSRRRQQQQKGKMSMKIIRVSDAMILPEVRGQCGETIAAGTLEAHANGFVYMATGFSLHFGNPKKSFFRLGDKRMPPLIHFQLHDPVMVGTEKAKDVQFHLVPCPLGQKRSDQDSDKLEHEKKKIRVGGYNEDLKNFVDEVSALWRSQLEPPCYFEELNMESEFYGVLPSMVSAGFALTSFSLVVLVKTPFFVVPLRDIDIVHLALLRPGEIDMTVIFQDFEVDNVLEINSIPLQSLDGIKCRLNAGLVKYYVNTEKQDWKSIVKGISDFPSEFMENGGWDYFKLEDTHTLAYYKEAIIDRERASVRDC